MSKHEERKDDMKKNNVSWCCCVVIALCILCGCETVIMPPGPGNDGRQGDPGEPHIGKSGEVTMYNLEAAALRLMEDMNHQLMADKGDDTEFKRNYEKKKRARKNERPTVRVDYINDSTNPRRPNQGRLDVVRSAVVRTKLQRSDLFTILPKDTRVSPDYVVDGYFKDVPESDGRHNHYLGIRLKDYKLDYILWEKVEKNVKLD